MTNRNKARHRQTVPVSYFDTNTMGLGTVRVSLVLFCRIINLNNTAHMIRGTGSIETSESR